MNSRFPLDRDIARLATIHGACRHYETDRVEDRAPRIEDYLASPAASERGVLLRELICLDIELREARGERPMADEYHQRFPDDRATIDRAFDVGRHGDRHHDGHDASSLPTRPPPQPAPSTEAGMFSTLNGTHPAVADDLQPGRPGREDPIPETIGDYELLELERNVLQRDLVAAADRSRGRFRSLLVTSLDNFVKTQWQRRSAKKRIAENSRRLDAIDDRWAVPPTDPHNSLDVQWVRELLGEVLRAMRDECAKSDRRDVWGVFEARFLAPLLGNSEPES